MWWEVFISGFVLGGISISGGSGTMVGAILALILIGEMRFGMGLINIPGQGQNIAIGVLLILSILIPYAARRLTSGTVRLDRPTLIKTAVVVGAVVKFTPPHVSAMSQ